MSGSLTPRFGSPEPKWTFDQSIDTDFLKKLDYNLPANVQSIANSYVQVANTMAIITTLLAIVQIGLAQIVTSSFPQNTVWRTLRWFVYGSIYLNIGATAGALVLINLISSLPAFARARVVSGTLLDYTPRNPYYTHDRVEDSDPIRYNIPVPIFGQPIILDPSSTPPNIPGPSSMPIYPPNSTSRWSRTSISRSRRSNHSISDPRQLNTEPIRDDLLKNAWTENDFAIMQMFGLPLRARPIYHLMCCGFYIGGICILVSLTMWVYLNETLAVSLSLLVVILPTAWLFLAFFASEVPRELPMLMIKTWLWCFSPKTLWHLITRKHQVNMPAAAAGG
ncbi:hypothetical protein FRC14_001005 [Serendipita sp. 396]|nr:hypothetical protein FRC14_001005 [Serendipita sp. 396]KAG8785739.1 hypothetical protein FRC15_000758 [Serendipita sp. 397]